jgi:Putative DNA-binding domain
VASGDLGDLQRRVADLVREVTPLPERADLAADVDAIALPGPRGMTPRDRLEVYRATFWWRHLASLEEDFPTLIAVLGGKAAFRRLASGYLAAFPPRTWDLQRLGADLPAFVASRTPWSDDPLAGDASRLDWAFMEAFDAADAPPFDPRVLASAPEEAWPAAHVDFHPSVRPLALRHPAHELREAVRRGEEPARPGPVPTHLVVHRDAACFLHVVQVEPPALALLETLRQGAPLGEACEACARATSQDPLDVGARLGGWFQDWTALGWVSAVRFGS